MNEQERKFLIGLEKLTRETGVVVRYCERCNAPYLETVAGFSLHTKAGYAPIGSTGRFVWVTPDDAYTWATVSKDIAK